MSVIIDADNEGLSIAFSAAQWTVLGWAKLAADVNRYTTIFDVSATTNNYMQFSTNDAGQLLGIHLAAGGVDSIDLTPGEWYRVAIRRDGTDFTLLVAGTTGALAAYTVAVPGGYAPTTLRIGRSVWSGEPWNGPLAGFKVYTAVLSDGEVATEFTRPEAIRTADLWAAYSLDAPPGTADSSGNGRTLTAGSAAVTDSADLPPYASPVPTPATVLNLGTGAGQNRFKLQLARPADANIDTISLAALAAGFTEAPYFHTTADGLRVHHEAQVDGPTTAGSAATRCELREVDATGADYSWDPATGEHDIRGTTTITALPPVKPEAVIAQIFNETGSADLASIRTQLVSGSIRLRFRYQGVSVTSPQMANPYAVGTEFAWRMRVVGGVIEVYWAFGGAALPGTPQITTAAVPTGQLCYFKAGLYNQSTTSNDAGTAIGAAELRSLAVTHTTAATAADYYVAANGNDANPGTLAAPWQTLTPVNNRAFIPGDTINLRGGDTFTGLLYLESTDSGTAVNPVRIRSYGTGRATLANTNNSAVYGYNTAGIEISGVNIVGGVGADVYDGISFYAFSTQPTHIRITDCDISGWKNGVAIGGDTGGGFADVVVTDCDLHDNRDAGLATYGPAAPSYANANVTVRGCTAYNNAGNPANTTTNSGNGIVLGSVQGGLVELCAAYNNGAACPAPEGPAGIWCYDADSITIQRCVAYDNQTNSTADGDGFDLDIRTSNSVIQYCLSYRNEGAGILVYATNADTIHAGNVIRYNLCWGNSRNHDYYYGEFTAAGQVGNLAVYHNTLIVRDFGAIKPPAVSIENGASGMTLRNNILHGGTGVLVRALSAYATAAVLAQGNDYWGGAGIKWGATTYATLAAWRAAITGQERRGGVDTGAEVNPQLVAVATAPTVTDPLVLTGADGLRLGSASTLAVTGLDLPALFGTDIGTRDYFGTPLTAPYSVGGHESNGPPDPRLTPLFGLDVNRFRAGLNLATAQNEGMAFVFGKVGQGSSVASGYGQTLDESWPTFRDSARAIGMPLGGYWYIGDTESPESQAARCRAWIGDRGIPLAMDWEEGGGEWPNVVACIAAFRAAGLTVRLLYARATWHAAHGGGDIAAQGLTLWNARYPSVNGGTPAALYEAVKSSLDTYWQAYGGVSTELLQYSDASTIATMTPVDANAYDGTPQEIAALLAPVAQPPASPRRSGAFAPFFPDRVVMPSA